MRQAHGRPVLVASGTSRVLSALRPAAPEAAFNEAWLQNIVHEHPECLPIEEIEPGFDHVTSVCVELPTKHGPIDNFLMTADGDLVLVEVKLWRNPEARRKVVAQALDYASCLFEMDYAELEEAVRKAWGGSRSGRLFDLFAGPEAKDEASFVDAVNANLRRGRALILVVGDGIRTEAMRLASLVQSHAGAHFTFALVELNAYQMPDDEGILVLPRTLAQTEMISRAIIQVDDRRTVVRPPSEAATVSAAPSPSAGNITAEQFYEAMAAISPQLPGQLRELLQRLEPLGVYPDYRRSLILRWDPPEGRAISLGSIDRSGTFWSAGGGHTYFDLSHQYLGELAQAFHGQLHTPPDDRSWGVTINGHAPKVSTIIQHTDCWVAAVEHYLDAVKQRLAE